jgi:hypothetical protein
MTELRRMLNKLKDKGAINPLNLLNSVDGKFIAAISFVNQY